MGANVEKMQVNALKETLVSYGLSEERTEKIAQLAVAYKKVSSQRALNGKEKDIFTKELLGLSFDQASKEMVEDYNGLISKAASKNGISPEAIKEIMGSVL